MKKQQKKEQGHQGSTRTGGVQATVRLAIAGAPLPESTTTRVLGQAIATIDTIDPDGVALRAARLALVTEMDRRRALPSTFRTFGRQGGLAVMVQVPWQADRVSVTHVDGKIVIAPVVGETP